MATFTKIPDGETPCIDVDPSRRVAKIDKNIYGGFLEHMGRCIYGGIYQPGHATADSHGYRTDVLKSLQSLDIPVMRYPGGNFVATYHWQDGIGPRESRPTRPELAWEGVETNEFGTDEFLHWLTVLGNCEGGVGKWTVEPYFALNFGTGTLDEALQWVEYCNGTGNTYYANLRRKNGRQEPWGVKYWALGNEMYGPWQVGQLNAEDYSKKAIVFAKALRLLDPSLVLVLCGETGYSSWDFEVLRSCIPYVDMHSIHIYTASSDHMKNVSAPLIAERAIEATAAFIDVARIENQIAPTKPRTTICFDEWNVWSPTRAPGNLGAEEKYTLSDALAVGVWLNVFVRQAKYMGMANIAQSVNVISPLMTTEKGIVKQTTFCILELFSRYMRGWTVHTHVRGGVYTGDTEPAWLKGVQDEGINTLDVSASVDKDGWVSVAVVNMDGNKDVEVDLKIGGAVEGGVETRTVTGENVDVVNTEEEEVRIAEGTWDGKGKYTFTKHSFTLLRWKSEEKISDAE
ncbi:hypothetical protein V496_09139 [Pseudogymnoascus sp. VKM F-4515 (FW-2607)]|nr:hypothetical protein V496_09139 [Pseudogymnoascus sp. VKM F-4515 (FW-2607)]KFY99233.1 hypothetical protein V498_00887 [Pseudogymnoascus sp. VKM F-4517 (FW-2822)]